MVNPSVGVVAVGLGFSANDFAPEKAHESTMQGSCHPGLECLPLSRSARRRT
jgi:hypothetical protein